MSKRLSAAIVVGLLFTSCGIQHRSESPQFLGAATSNAEKLRWMNQSAMYFALVDRFANGNPGNDKAGDASQYDPSRPYFFHGGDLKGIEQKIPYLKDLGIENIWTNPINKQVPLFKNPKVAEIGKTDPKTDPRSETGYHGYWWNPISTTPNSPENLKIEEKFGMDDDFNSLLNALHANGMRFTNDLVFNHVGYGAWLEKNKPDWFNKCTDTSICGEIDSVLYDLPDLNQRKDEVARFLTDWTKAWLNKFPGIDSIRLDAVKHIPTSFFKDYLVKEVFEPKDKFTLGEALDYNLGVYDDYITKANLDSMFNFVNRKGLIDTFAKGGSVDNLAESVKQTIDKFGQFNSRLLVNFLDNHDTDRYLQNIPWGTSSDEAHQRYKMALVALGTMPGVMKLQYGDEIGMVGANNQKLDHRRDMPSWAFSDLGRKSATASDKNGLTLEKPAEIYDFTKQIIQLRKDYCSLRTGDYREMWRQNGPANPDAYVFMRETSGCTPIITVFNNGSADSGVIRPNIQTNPDISTVTKSSLPDGTVFKKILGTGGPDLVTVTDGQFKVSLPGKSVAIYAPQPALSNYNAAIFEVDANTSWGENVYLYGSNSELGRWNSPADPTADRAIKMNVIPGSCIANRCRWTVKVKYIQMGTSFKYKFLKKNGSSVVYEGGLDREHTVPNSTFPMEYTVGGSKNWQ